MRVVIGILCGLVIGIQALALDISTKDVAAGLKEALTRGADTAVQQLGKPNGFLGDARVRIPLPDSLHKAERFMRTFGMGKYADELVETMNHAAESAVVEAKPILIDAVKRMSFDDARAILTGGDDAATRYLQRTTSGALTEKFLPVVKRATARVRLADKYNKFAGEAARVGLIDAKDADLDRYVTQKALDGLFVVIAEKEKAIRQDPLGTGSRLLREVFGSLRR